MNEHAHRLRCGIDACQTFLNQETSIPDRSRYGSAASCQEGDENHVPPWKYHQSLWLIPCLKVKKTIAPRQTLKLAESFNFYAHSARQNAIPACELPHMGVFLPDTLDKRGWLPLKQINEIFAAR
ncbi:hypothetical protein [Agrobacterium tumefaciens]|uniref:hypothetical protein n=1 Tax=Agrobacterium tumefaciens TaxID=358 RepID=UPI00287CB66E|nr:hypothetical protein [Agrobacterium tumefaciens]MDS7596127.1 hypothetical protein [Agrobacterium tumefaciens]